MYIRFDPAAHAALIAQTTGEARGIRDATDTYLGSTAETTERWSGLASTAHRSAANDWAAEFAKAESKLAALTADAHATGARLEAANDVAASIW